MIIGLCVARYISTHAPLARRDPKHDQQGSCPRHFYSRASCEARLANIGEQPILNKISTHAPLARRDLNNYVMPDGTYNFYSRASCEARLETAEEIDRLIAFLLTRLLRGATLS